MVLNVVGSSPTGHPSKIPVSQRLTGVFNYRKSNYFFGFYDFCQIICLDCFFFVFLQQSATEEELAALAQLPKVIG